MNRNRAVLPIALAALVLAVVPVAGAQTITPVVQVPLSPNRIPQFIDPLPVLGNGIPVVLGPAIDLSVCEFQANILPAGALGKQAPGAPATWVWGYRQGSCPSPTNPLVSDSYIGPVIVAQKGVATKVTYRNSLGSTLDTKVTAFQQATDQTLMWADPLNGGGGTVPGFTGPSEQNYCADFLKNNPGQPLPTGCTLNYAGPIAVAPHLHGGEIPAMLDGGPDAWWTATGQYGHGYYTSTKTGEETPPGAAVYNYPNGQDAAPIWFHDHTLGATRLNVYAGIAGAYMIVDDPTKLPPGMTTLGLSNGTNPLGVGALGELLVPVVLQDRMFDVNGQLLFPNVGINPEHPFWIPEFVGDTIVVNGKAWPFHNVEPKRYRFLFLNGSNARAYELFLVNKATGAKGPAMWVIGTDQGYLDTPVKIDPNVKPNDKLIIMPGERYEVIIDFGNLPAGTRLLLSNTAKTPYPAGGPVSGRTTGRVMEFRVTGCTSGLCAPDPSYDPASALAIRTGPDSIQRLADPVAGTQATLTVHKVRRLTLNEVIGPGGPLEILVNNTTYVGNTRDAFGGCTPGTNECGDFTKITTEWNTTYYSELPNEGETELWEIVNLTADAHPVHPHLVAFQLMNRQAFDLKGYDALYNGSFPGGLYLPGWGPPLDYNCGGPAPGPGSPPCTLGGNPDVTPFLVGAALPPLPSEAGWKDTVIAYPGQVTRFLVRFAPTHLPNDTPPSEAFYDFDPNGGHGYVWHCHIIDHEDNEMMRPFSVFANPSADGARGFVKGVDF